MLDGNDPVQTPAPTDEPAATPAPEPAEEPRDPSLPPDPVPAGEAPPPATEDKLDEVPLPDGTTAVAEPPVPEEEKDELDTPAEQTPEEKKAEEEKTREEKRAERTDATGTRFIDRVKRDVGPAPAIPDAPEYNPLDLKDDQKYIKEVKNEDGEVVRVVDAEKLEEDRKAGQEYAAAKARQETATQIAAQNEQQRFFDQTETDAKLLSADKDFEFLKDPQDQRAQFYNESFALATGYQAVPVYDDQGRPVVGPDGRPQMREYVANPGIGYANFVKEMKAREDKIIEDRMARSKDNKQAIADKSGIKPGGEPAKTKKLPSLDDVHGLQEEDWEKTKPLLEKAYGVNRPG